MLLTNDLTTKNDETQIRALIDDRVKAVRAKDINGATSNIVPDILMFDVVNPLHMSDPMHPENARRNGSHRFKAQSATRFTT